MANLINAASIARVTDKNTGKFLGFLVKSDHTEAYYQVTCLKISGHCEFFCTCKGFQFHGHCKHCDACKELCAARKELDARKTTKKPLPRINTSKYGLTNPNYRPHHVACSCGADDWQGHYRKEFENYQIQQQARAIVAKRFTELEQKRDEARASGGFSILR